MEDDESLFLPEFDADGNQTRVQTSTGSWAVSYNNENRPTDFTAQDAEGNFTTVHCSYDYMGRRSYKKVISGGEVVLYQRYIYRGYLQIACIDLTRSHHPVMWLLLWDPTQPVATRPLAIQKDGTWRTYGLDLTKNVCEVFGSNGYINTAYTYTPFGEVTASGSVTQPIQWSSEFHDPELGMVYYNYRHYNTRDGRWISRDPMEEVFTDTLYSYVSNRIVQYHDYRGLLFGGDNCKEGTMRKFKAYMAVRSATHFTGKSPQDDEKYKLNVNILSELSELAPTGGLPTKKLQNNMVKSRDEIMEYVWDNIEAMRENLAKNDFQIVIWYKFEAECCKCIKSIFWGTRYNFEKVETDWVLYPTLNKNQVTLRHSKYERKNVLTGYAHRLNRAKKELCK